jgi:hypothetical protein
MYPCAVWAGANVHRKLGRRMRVYASLVMTAFAVG